LSVPPGNHCRFSPVTTFVDREDLIPVCWRLALDVEHNLLVVLAADLHLHASYDCP